MNIKKNIKKNISFPIIDIFKFQWKKALQTPIHDHAKYGCIMFLVKGKLREDIFDTSRVYVKYNIHKAPSISYINDKKGFHSVEPLEDSISYHFYFPKGHKTNYYTMKYK